MAGTIPMNYSFSTGTGNNTFTMDSNGWGGTMDLPWLRDAANDVLKQTGVQDLVNNALAAEAGVVKGVMDPIMSGISNLLGIGNWGENSRTTTYIDNTTGQRYGSLPALYVGRSTADLVAQGYPENVARSIAILQQFPDKVPADLKTKLDAYAKQTGAADYIYGNEAYGTNYSSLFKRMFDQQIGTPAQQKQKNDRLNFLLSNNADPQRAYTAFQQEGFTVGPEQQKILQDAQVAYTKKRQDDLIAQNPAFADVANKYSSTNPPKVGTKDAVLYGQYIGLPMATLDKLQQAYQQQMWATDAQNALANNLMTMDPAAAVKATMERYGSSVPITRAMYDAAVQANADRQAGLLKAKEGFSASPESLDRLRFLMKVDPENGAKLWQQEGYMFGPEQQKLVDEIRANAANPATAAATIPQNVPGTYSGPNGEYVPNPDAVAAANAATAARDKEMADREAARIAADTANQAKIDAANKLAAEDLAAKNAAYAAQLAAMDKPAAPNTPGTFTGPGGAYVPFPDAAEKFAQGIADQKKYYADKEAARIAAYEASPEGQMAAAARKAYDAQQLAMATAQAAPAAVPQTIEQQEAALRAANPNAEQNMLAATIGTDPQTVANYQKAMADFNSGANIPIQQAGQSAYEADLAAREAKRIADYNAANPNAEANRQAYLDSVAKFQAAQNATPVAPPGPTVSADQANLNSFYSMAGMQAPTVQQQQTAIQTAQASVQPLADKRLKFLLGLATDAPSIDSILSEMKTNYGMSSYTPEQQSLIDTTRTKLTNEKSAWDAQVKAADAATAAAKAAASPQSPIPMAQAAP